jgi:ankyrin repeat protein
MIQRRFNLATPMLALLLAPASLAADTAAQPDIRLPEAVKSGDALQVKKLLRAHVAVDSPEGDGTTALHWAVTTDNLALAELLLASHANVDAETRLAGLTPLHLAAQSGNAPMVELLVKHGVLVNKANGHGTTPLMMAAASGSAAAVTALVEHGADVNLREHVHEQTALMFAANLDRADAIKVLIAHGADPNASSKVVEIPKINFREMKAEGKKTDGKTEKASDSVASKEEDTGKVSKKEATARAEGIRADATKPDYKDPPVEKSAAIAKSDGAKPGAAKAEAPKEDELIAAYRKAAAERNAKVMGGMTPLLYAAREGNLAAATALLDGGAKIDEVSGSEHSTPLVLAIANGHYDFAKLMIDRGANVNLANDMGVAPLYATIDVRWPPHEWSAEPIVDQEKTDYLTLMKLLLAKGANPNAQIKKQVWSRILSENRNWIDPTGSTPFWRAAQADDVKAMEVLKAGGADPKMPSKIGTTPLMVAAGLGWSANYSTTSPTRLAAIEYCMSQGADVNAKDTLGYTPLHGAAFVGDLKNIQYLVDHGAKIDAKTKAGDTVADLANGPFEKSLPNPEAVTLLVKLGSVNSNNCRSSDCVPPVKEDKKPVVAEVKDPKKPAAGKASSDR